MPNRKRLNTFQGRLGAIQDKMRRTLIDNNTTLVSDATDVIRLKVRKTYEGDAVSWICQKADIINVVFPPLNDVPIRKIKINEETLEWELSSLVDSFDDNNEKQRYSISVPYNCDIDVEDLLFRIFTDPDQNMNIIVILQVVELLGTFGHHQLIMQKCGCTIPTEDIPEDILTVVKQMSERRSILGY